jgi:hypothetical protein
MSWVEVVRGKASGEAYAEPHPQSEGKFLSIEDLFLSHSFAPDIGLRR